MNEALWTWVEQALDERRDPRRDPRVAAAVADDPEAAAELERLLGRLETLSTLRAADPELDNAESVALAHGSRARWAAAAALVLALGSGWWPRTTEPTRTSADAEPDVSLVIEHGTTKPATGARVVLESKYVLAWTLEGETP